MSGASRDYDVAIVGGGHNGLVCGYYLARAGLRVAIFEAREAIGGACKTEELIPGYRFSTCANWVGWWRPKIIEDMRLLDRGVEVGGTEFDSRVLPDGRGFVWWPDEEALVEEISRFSESDARQWRKWRKLWDGVARQLGPWLLSYPPTQGDLVESGRGGNVPLASLRDKSVAEVTDKYFTSEVMRSGIVAPHDVGSLYEPGSALLMALEEAMANFSETGQPAPKGYVRGGMGQITQAMAAAALEAGAAIFTGMVVQQVATQADRAVGILLEDGEHVSADRVVLGCDPRTAARLAGDALGRAFKERLTSLKATIAPLKLHCALSDLPEWRAFPGSDIPHRGRHNLCRTREQSEQAWQAAARGELPTNPFMVAMTPSYWDTSLAPPDHHTLSVWTLYAPVRPAEGTWNDRRGEMLDLMLTALEREAPGLRERLVDAVLLTPEDLENRVGLSMGNIHHIDLSPDQILWQRPMPELARYRFPINGLYGCGSSHHPYGEVSGGPGHNAAHAILEDASLIDHTWQQTTVR